MSMNTPSSETPARVDFVSKVRTMEYPVHKVKKNALGRIVRIRNNTVREELKMLDAVLPAYDKRRYRVSDRLSLAISFAAYLEGIIATAAPEKCPVPLSTVPLISEFSLYHLTDDKSKEKESNENQVTDVPSTPEEGTGSDVSTSQAETSEPEDEIDNNVDCLFPELQQLSQPNDVDTVLQTCCSTVDAWCCCPDRAVEEQTCHMSTRSRASNRHPSCKPEQNTAEVQVDEVHLAERASYINTVLRRMETAVKVAQIHTT